MKIVGIPILKAFFVCFYEQNGRNKSIETKFEE